MVKVMEANPSILWVVLASIGFLDVGRSEEWPNGFYTLRDEGTVQKKIDLTIRRATLMSLDNLNKQFQLMVFVPFETPQMENLFIVVDGKKVNTSSHGASEGVERDYNFKIPVDSIVPVSKFLKIKAEYRKHPGHKIHTAFETTKTEYILGRDIRLKLVISNLGDTAIAFLVGGSNRGSRDNQFSFSLFCDLKPVPDLGDPRHFGGESYAAVVKPGEKFEQEVDLLKWFKFDKEGFCEGVASFYLAITEKHSFKVIWEDFATAPFHFKVRKHA